MEHVFFGYGSLVNRRTHDYAPALPARVAGWRRVWRATGHRQLAFLSVVPDADCAIEGLVAEVPGGDWAALDAREFAYAREPLAAGAIRHGLAAAARVQIYAVPEDGAARALADHPILLSYLDVVVQGFAAEFGNEGVARFFATTGGWEAPILDDRAAPRYPRAQRLTEAERALVDGHLAALGAARIGG